MTTYHDFGLKVDEDGTGNVLASPSLGEECVEGVVSSCLVQDYVVRVDPVLQAVQLPARIADLHTSLPNVHRCMHIMICLTST